jgi:formylglycine-generating enzyme required for sulfatase activity
VDFLDAEEMATAVTTGKKIIGLKEKPSNKQSLSKEEQVVIKKSLEQVKLAVAEIDVNRLAYFFQGPKGRKHTVKSIDMELIWCPPGRYVRGEGDKSHQVILTKGFYLGKYEVTQKQYEKIMGKNPSNFKGEKLPVEMISWKDATIFCELLSKKERSLGWKFALPTEAQWEYACRAGTSTIYSWGNSIKLSLGNFTSAGFKHTVEVGSYPPNPWGLHDMHGNVREWCQDWYGPYHKDQLIDPEGPEAGSEKVYRGGGWGGANAYLGSGNRAKWRPELKGSSFGFRVALKQVD